MTKRKVVVAYCSNESGRERVVNEISRLFCKRDCAVQPLFLAAPDDADRLLGVVSLRMLPIETMCDLLLCLDPYAGVLLHSNKHVWLSGGLEDLDRSEARDEYFINTLLAGLQEAQSCFAESLDHDFLLSKKVKAKAPFAKYSTTGKSLEAYARFVVNAIGR